MIIQVGDLLCLKTTGELVCVVKSNERRNPDEIQIRRPKETKDGVVHVSELVFDFELESPEAHLQRKAEAYVLNLEMQKSVIGKKIKSLEREVQADTPEVIDISRLKVN